jgi:hypothetical protein
MLEILKSLYINFQMRTNLLGILIALCLISSVQTQAFAGGILPHLYTGIAVAELSGDLLQNYTYSFPLSRTAFTSTEEVLTGTSLRDYSFQSLATAPVAPATDPYIHI